MSSWTVWFLLLIQFLIILCCAVAVCKLCSFIHFVNWIRELLHGPKQENANVANQVSRFDSNQSAGTQHSMISMPQLPVTHQVPIMLPYPTYPPPTMIQGESQGQDLTQKSASHLPPPYPMGFRVTSPCVTEKLQGET